MERLDNSIINKLIRASGARDKALLHSFLRFCTTAAEARETIDILKRNLPHIWSKP